MKKILLLLGTVLFLSQYAACEEPKFGNKRFGEVRVVGTQNEATSAAIFLSEFDANLAERLTTQKILSMWISPKAYLAGIKEGDKGCSYLAGELERMSQAVQSSIAQKGYLYPRLYGSGAGAAIALTAYAQHPIVFSSLVTENFKTASIIPCRGDALSTDQKAELARARIGPLKNWINLGALPGWAAGIKERKDVSTKERLFATLNAPLETSKPTPLGLPIVELHGQATFGNYLGFFLSGDGGWATIDRDVGEYLSKKDGFPIVGFDALKFFWSRKTPEETAEAVEKVLRRYSEEWRKDRFIMIGFSLGGDITPFIVNRLPADLKSKIAGIVLLSPATVTDFEVHIADWIGIGSGYSGYDVVAEAQKLTVPHILCITGKEDDDSLCSHLKGPGVVTKVLDGGHHFSGDYGALGELILNQIITEHW